MDNETAWRALADALTHELGLEPSADEYVLDTDNIRDIARGAVQWLATHGYSIVRHNGVTVSVSPPATATE